MFLLLRCLTIGKKNRPKAIAAFSACFVILTVLFLIGLIREPVYTDQTTCPATGTVTKVNIETHYGYKGRRYKRVYLTLEDGNLFRISGTLLKEVGMSCEEFQNIAVGRTADIRYSSMNHIFLATISIDGNEIINYDAINEFRNNRVVGMVVVYIIFIISSIFLILCKFIEFDFSPLRRQGKKNAKK